MGECSKTCGRGTRLNTRTKKVEEVNGGICEGESTISDSCNTEDCPGSESVFNIFALINVYDITFYSAP